MTISIHKTAASVFFTCLISFMLYPGILFAQLTDSTGTAAGTRGALQVYKHDARISALGDAAIADYHDLSAINLNPAALSFVRNVQTVHVNLYQNWENNLMVQNFTFPALVQQSHRVTAQFGIHHSGFNATTFIDSGTRPKPDLMMYQADLAYAYSVENILSIGILNSVSFANNEHARFWTYYATLGALYAPSQSISYGIAFRGLGRSITYELIDDGRTTLGSQSLRESLELGATLKFPVDTDHTWLSLSLANIKHFGQSGIWYTGGLEIKPVRTVAVRSGILFHPENNLYLPRFGIGIQMDRIRLDYAISHKHQLDNRYHQLGLTLQL